MIIIHKPELITEKDTVIIRSLFEMEDSREYLWFSVAKEHQDYLTYRRGDAFLVGILLLAMEKGHDIQLNFPVSERLYYTLTTYLIKALSLAISSLTEISIIHGGLDSTPIENAGAVGTGFSGGVDSFCTVYEHLHENCPESLKLTHFTFHNVGSHGDFGGEDSRKLFKERLKLVKPFADEKGIDIISVDSNLSEILTMDYIPTHTIRNAAVILLMQKLFRYYYYSSGYEFTEFAISPKLPSASYDILSLNMLSTESLTFFSAGASYNRFEKTKMIANYEPTYRYLNVCTSGSSTNCSACSKCLRTMLTFEVLGKLEKYKQTFDLKKHKKLRPRFIGKVLGTHKSDRFLEEIYQEMKKDTFTIPTRSFLLAPLYWVKSKMLH